MSHQRRPPDGPGAVLGAIADLVRIDQPAAAVLLLTAPSASCQPAPDLEPLWLVEVD